MSMSEWAKREIEIAIEREKKNAVEGEWDYGVGCYNSALKAYLSLMEDGHSGMSWDITFSILNKLAKGEPLTPIEDTPDIWGEPRDNGDYTTQQCKRMYSLFRDVDKDGNVSYHDIGSYVMVDHNDNDNRYHSGFVYKKIKHLLPPITMPYTPSKSPSEIYVENFLFDENNGDYDTMGIMDIDIYDGFLVTPVNRYFKEENREWVEIDVDEYNERKEVSESRKNK